MSKSSVAAAYAKEKEKCFIFETILLLCHCEAYLFKLCFVHAKKAVQVRTTCNRYSNHAFVLIKSAHVTCIFG